MVSRSLVVCLAAFVLTVVAGCGGDRATVTGKLLRKDGAPLVGARVIATSAESGKSAYGTTDQHGEFELGVSEQGDGVPPGSYEIMIVEDRGDPDNRRPATIAAKYRESSRSGLELNVTAGDIVELNATLDPP